MDQFGTDLYFSESQKQLIRVSDMPLPYARNVLLKMLREGYDGFRDSVLHKCLLDHLQPSAHARRLMLQAGQPCSFFCGDPSIEGSGYVNGTNVRSRFYSTARRLGIRVVTHRNGDFIEATVPVAISVRGH